MKRARPNYLRTHRKRCGFTQREVGFLVGLQSGQVISRYEVNSLVPHLRTVLACQIIFNVIPHELFPDMHREVAFFISERIALLLEELQTEEPSRAVRQKQYHLQSVLKRINELSNTL